MQIQDHVFLVTGAASGLGAATARMFVAEGASVIVADLNRPAGEALAVELGPKACFAATDVTSEHDAKSAVDLALECIRPSAWPHQLRRHRTRRKNPGPRSSASLGNFTRAIHINLIGSFNMLRLAAQAIAESEPEEGGERGVIVNTASVAAYDGQIGQAAYAASKGGVVSLTLPAARELARFGIRVVTIAPGIFETPMMAGFSHEVQDALGKSVPFPPRLGRPAEYAALVKHICQNSMLNGETIRLDGALRMAAK